MSMWIRDCCQMIHTSQRMGECGVCFGDSAQVQDTTSCVTMKRYDSGKSVGSKTCMIESLTREEGGQRGMAL